MPSFSLQYRGQVIYSDTLEGIVKYAGRVAEAQERERCAKIADSHAETSRRDARIKRDVYGANPATSMASAHAAEYIAFKIRSGEP